MSKAVVLLSGGLDSSTTLAIADQHNEKVHALTFKYGQKNDKEINSAEKLADHFSVEEHKVLNIQVDKIGRSSLLESGDDIPDHEKDEIGDEIPSTYVPARNIIFLSYALSYAESIEADHIYIGATSRDYSGYPDCRPEFFDAFQKVIEEGTKRGVENKSIQIKHPIINMSKAEIVKKGDELNVPFHMTWSCYKGDKKACGKCDSCKLRLKGFEEADLEDPIKYDINT